MTSMLYGRTALTHEEMWPKKLLRKHDELTALNLQEKGKDSWSMYLAGFKMIQEKYGQLQWTDGELCIRLPSHNGDLIREGEVLRHCVGTYSAVFSPIPATPGMLSELSPISAFTSMS